MKSLVLLIGALLLTTNLAWAQCAIQTSTNNVCLGNTVSFSRSPASAQDSAFLWDFGDGSSSTQAGTTYQYTVAGVYTINLKIYKIGGSVCVAPPIKIRVFPKPIAQFTVNDKSQCFNYNNFVFTDLSGPGASNAPIKRRTFLYGDGAFNQQNRPLMPSVTYSYTNPLGGKYAVLQEVEDTNGCLNQITDTVIVFKKLTAMFSFIEDVRCSATLVTFYNFSEGDTIGSNYTWLFGDGNVGSLHSGFVHTYLTDTTFYPTLIIKNKVGCSDTMVSDIPVTSFRPDTLITIETTDRKCFSNNAFTFKNKSKIPPSVSTNYWVIRSADLVFQRDSIKQTINFAKFPTCGEYSVKLLFNYKNCIFQTDTVVYVYGPQAVIAVGGPSPLNAIQCGAYDTVKFRLNDYNCYYANSNVNYFWDFDDGFAPACTTDTKNNINTTLNCRYSIDSANVQHFYAFPNQTCYTPKLIVVDPNLPCSDTSTTKLRLAYPKVGMDYTKTPAKPRAYAIPVDCDIFAATVKWDDVEPKCGAEEVWLLPDTSCALKIWSKVDTIGLFKEYKIPFGRICTKDTLVYFGIVARNGLDQMGLPCFDTAYYPYTVKRLPDLNFKVTLLDTDYCAPHQIKIVALDTIVKLIRKIEYHFGDQSPPFTQYFNGTDSIVKPVYHTYTKNGTFDILVIIEGDGGCFSNKEFVFKVGNLASLEIHTPRVCNGVPAFFKARVRYEKDTAIAFWSRINRFNEGKEQLYWNFGDDTSWYAHREEVSHRYAIAGTYFVRIAFKDSSLSGCFDTLASSVYKVIVTSTVANIGLDLDTFYCAPAIVKYYDSSYVLFGSQTPIYTGLADRLWKFDDGKGNSTLEQPALFYSQNGTYSSLLYATSVYGCVDSTSRNITVIGPTPKFVISNDTFGCVPYQVRLKNNTGKQLTSWIWYFNDSLNTVLSTNQDTDFVFTYTKPGVYKIDLLGEDRIFNPTTGSYKTCSETFPKLDNTGSFHPRQVTVLPYDTLKILAPDTVCLHVPFNVKSYGTTQTNDVKWSWGDSSALLDAEINKTVQHQFDTSKLYLVKVFPVITVPGQCVLPNQKYIFAQTPKAAFEYDLKTYPEIQFTNFSVEANRYWWDFSDVFSGENNSDKTNPTHQFSSTDSLFKVCLSAFDSRDCMDSVCKYVSIKTKVRIPNVFTPGNADQKNDAFDIDIEGYEKYDLVIYNRWGTKVYESKIDGIQNDGINWNGKDKNTGDECAEGVYYVVFTYRLITDTEDQIYHGTVTLIRN